ncbi:helix-turn-helix transcriptional regulator [Streptomyces sp. H27-C3]|uniref:helix-turn-helix domain-containing protein n=1 Tax=Streptomyces sp. H27-C3 TaxID=3046305 RepID=UPI0024B89A9D|nr:helix-turn-helix transcriptional regulator [Streptomyces sp. H27-C3]MDJ0460565.1 helix-turn-helix transcriptional regulator [Streptomyces sp. H27-C3]
MLSEPPSPAWVLTRRRAVGDHIREARLYAKLTQEQLGGASGVDRQAINRIEQGHASPRLDSLIRIAAALNISLADLVRT